MSEILGSLFKYFMAVLAVVGVVAIAAKSMTSDKVGTAISDTTQAATDIRSTFANNPVGFANLTTARAATGKLFPESMIVGSALTNPWNGSVTVQPEGDGFSFSITHTNVPVEACPKLASSQTQISAASINGQAMNVPVDAGLAISQCAADNTIVFRYKR